MGNHNSGRRPQKECQYGHPLEGDNVILIKRKYGDAVKIERACRACNNRRQREYWRKRNGSRQDG